MDILPAPPSCPACEAVAPSEAAFCSRCGFPLTDKAPARAARAKWYHNFWVVLILMLFVLGPFALPLIWGSPTSSRSAKVALTLLTLAYTAWALILIAQAFSTGLRHLNDLGAGVSF